MKWILPLAVLAATSWVGVAVAREFTVATWNLGWHMDRALAEDWIEACDATYALDAATGKWKPSSGAGSQPGWDVDVFQVDGWDTARFPVCDIYQFRDQDNQFKTIPVTLTSYEKRLTQIATFIANNVAADIIAFQEVSGEQAVKDVLPGGGAGFEICSFTNFKVQRLAIAWKTSLGTLKECRTEEPLSLPGNTPDKQPRPGLSLTLDVDGQLVRVLTVHLKSSCVSPFDRGDLAGGGNHCPILQQQVAPVEAWIERETAGVDKTILIGDFNRNFWHEIKDTAPVRSDSSDPKGALPVGVLVRSFFEEVADGEPAASSLTMLEEACPTNEVASLLCQLAKTRKLEAPELDLLRFSGYLGCRNPVGLDHVLHTRGLSSTEPAVHVPIGRFGGSKPANDSIPEPLLAIADHCPMTARFSF